MLMIKMAKVGKTNKKVFRIIISEKARDPYGRALEILGSYDPYDKKLDVKADRVKHWISQGAQMTASINNLFIDNKIIDGGKVKNSKPGTPNKRKTEKVQKEKDKELAKAKEVEDAKKAAEEAKNKENEAPAENNEEGKAE